MKIKYLVFLFPLMLFFSCEGIIDITPGIENFDVSVEKSTVKVGEQVLFTFEGNPDLISFYSGEIFHQYDLRDGREEDVLETLLSFSSAIPTLADSQPDQLSVLISSDYIDNGNDYADIIAAHWVDITDRFDFAISGVYVNSGDVDISDLLNSTQPFTIAFRYKNDISKGAPNRWTIQNFSLVAKTGDTGNISLGTIASAGFRLVEQHPEFPSKSTLSNTLITMVGDVTQQSLQPSDTWAISSHFASGTIDFGPDRTIGLKGMDSRLDSYSYVYRKSGEYNVVFVAKNVTVDQEKEVMKSLIIRVEE